MITDPRANSTTKIDPPGPLPYVSRKALRRVKDWIPAPSECRYCSGNVELVSNDEIYNGRQYGAWPYAYLCRPCDAFVGLHPDTDLPLGTLANKSLREERKKAKAIWQQLSRANGWTRNEAYHWLAQQLDIPKSDCHFGHFDIDLASQAYQICRREVFT